MSKGPGKVQRAIRDAFNGRPEHAFTIRELTGLAYPSGAGTWAIEATARAARAVAKQLGWVKRGGGRNPILYISPAVQAAEQARGQERSLPSERC
jgi:hypothetical protein